MCGNDELLYRIHNSSGKIIGTHIGAQFYTIGQRKGLGIGGHSDSVFVLHTDVDRNIIYVGQEHDHKGLSRSCLVIRPDEIHWIRSELRMEAGEINPSLGSRWMLHFTRADCWPL